MEKNIKKTFLQKLRRWLIYGILAFVIGSILSVFILGIIPISSSSFMLRIHIADYQSGKEFTPIQQQWRDKQDISKHMFSAVIAAEDQLFHQHMGFDINAIKSAIKDKLSGQSLRGASTISQQVAKNLFLSSSRSLWRKGAEAWFTLLIEFFWSKERILLVYVNIAEFGDHLFGVEAASQYYFAHTASTLTAKQSALLAASLPNPAIFKVDKPNKKLKHKQQWILRQMRNLGYL